MRKQLYISAVVIGAVGVVAGGSTLAVFSDTEASDNNVFTAGSLDVQLDWDESYNGEPIESQELTDNPGPIFELEDVKPGDQGEATISMHVFDNPGWLWLRMNMSSNDDVSSTEPELEADTPENDSDSFDGELAETVKVNLWYDEDGDNVYDAETEERIISGGNCSTAATDISITLDESGSMDNIPEKFEAAKNGSQILVESIGTGQRAALVSFSSSAQVRTPLTSNKTRLHRSIEDLTAGGGTNIEDAIEDSHKELVNGSEAREDADKVMILLSDGEATSGSNPVDDAEDAKDDGIRIITIAYGDNADDQLLNRVASEGDFYEASQADVSQVFATVQQQICGEPTLASVEQELDEGIRLDGNRTEDGVQPFTNSTTQYIGFSWHIPNSTGNVIQTDETVFDLDFYGEQRRHNDQPVNPWIS